MEKYFRAENILKIYPGAEIIEKTLKLLKQYKTTKQAIFDLQSIFSIRHALPFWP